MSHTALTEKDVLELARADAEIMLSRVFTAPDFHLDQKALTDMIENFAVEANYAEMELSGSQAAAMPDAHRRIHLDGIVARSLRDRFAGECGALPMTREVLARMVASGATSSETVASRFGLASGWDRSLPVTV